MMTKYVRVTKLGGRAYLLPNTQDIEKFIGNKHNESWFVSPLFYNEEHKKQFDKTKSVKGIRDVTTNRLWVDIDTKELTDARESTLEVCKRFLDKGFKEHNIQVTFSGNKGFHIQIETDTTMKVSEVKSICVKMFDDIKGFDDRVYLPTQILRIPNTKHSKSKLYSIPMTYTELKENDVPETKSFAKDRRDDALNFHPATMPKEVYSFKDYIKPKEEKAKKVVEHDFDFTQLNFSDKPKGFTNPLYALSQGFFLGSESADTGERQIAFLTIAANMKALGYDKEMTYGILKTTSRLQSQRTGENPYSKEKIWNDILNSVYADSWQGGSGKEFMEDYTAKYDIPNDGSDDETLREIVTTLSGGYSKFRDYVKEIDKNTIKTGIKSLDDNLTLLTGRVMGITAPPSCGKTAVAFQMLSNMSKNGVNSIYCPYDSSSSNVYMTLLMRHTGLPIKDILQKFKDDPSYHKKAEAILERNYPNTQFVWKTTQTCDQIRKTIKHAENNSGEKIKVVFVDYLELISTDASDDTGQTKKAILGLQEIAQEENVLVIVLLQPNKIGTDLTKPFKNYNQVKGSSAINQSVSVLVSLCRPGWSPNMENDNYMTLTCLKNKIGGLFNVDLAWEGKRMSVRELESVEVEALKEFREATKDDDGGF
jgi:replicative DNA helicase